MISKSKVDYYLIQNTLVDEDIAMSKREIISENVVNSPNGSLFTITYNQVLQDFNTRNWNGRIYTPEIVMKALDTNPLIQNDIKSKTWCAEYGHPQISKGTNELARQMTIYPPMACNTINKYWREGDILMGECTTLAGGYGDILRDRIITNFPAMSSSRAVGGVDAKGVVLAGYTVVTFDTVIRPSHKVAYMVPGSEKVNNFPLGQLSAGGNSMSECTIKYDPASSEDFKNFIMSESVSRDKISMACDAFNMDYSTMEVTDRAIRISKVDGLMQETVVIPLNKLVGLEYANLFN